jgi:peptidoglycan hydrolase-like protein with peptidoglycan-binding domain
MNPINDDAAKSLSRDDILRKALRSNNPEAILRVAYAFNDLGEVDKANGLIERVQVFYGIQGWGFGVDYLAVQQKLNSLGASPPLTTDGKWGPKSKAALLAFQKTKGLKVDGIPGPQSLTALGISSATTAASSTMGHVMPSNDSTDAQAYAIAKKAGAQAGMTEQEIQYVISVAKGEGGYGNGWGHPSAKTIQESKAFGISGSEGVGSNNWGAVQGNGSAGSFPHVDHDAKGKAYLGHYKKYKTPEEGFLDMAHTILGGGPIRKAVGATEIKQAIGEGSLRKAVYAQHANGYFELNPESYLSAVVSNYNRITNGIGWPKVLDENGITPGIAAKIAGGTMALWGLAALAVFLFRKQLGLVRI